MLLLPLRQILSKVKMENRIGKVHRKARLEWTPTLLFPALH